MRLLRLALLGQLGVTAQFVTPADYVLAEEASQKTASVCEDFEALEADEKQRLKGHLMTSSANNVIRELLREGNGESPLDLFIAKIQEPGFALQLAGPVAACLMIMFIYFTCCCWTACCRCCRCCKRERQAAGCCKFLMFLLLVGIAVGLAVAAFLALAGLDAAVDGVDRTACSSAQLLNTTLAGRRESPKFLGLLPVLEIFQTLADSLLEDSQFISDVKSILDSTQEISTAVTLLSQTMGLLNDMVSDTANRAPATSDGTSLKHNCALCETLSSALTPAVEALDGSVAEALRAARAEVDKQLSGEKLQELRNSMLTFSEPVSEFKAALRSFLGPFIEEETLDVVKQQMETSGKAGATSFAILALLLNFCAILTVLCWCTSGGASGGSKAIVHRCACCTWCCGCWYLFLAFFVGGLLNVIAVPLSSFCLILDDLDGELLMDISAMANMNFTGPQGAMTIALVENCINPETPRNPALMDLITTSNDDGTTSTMNEKIVGDVTSQITKQFDEIQTGNSGAGDTLADDGALKQLIATIGDFPMDAMMLPVNPETEFPNMATTAELQPFLLTSSACGEVANSSFNGIDAFVSQLDSFCCSSGVLADYTCAKNVECSFETAKAQACEDGNSLMDLKQQLRNSSIFKCKVFQGPAGPCDIRNMTEVSAGAYVNDCMVNGLLEVMEYDCTLEELTDLVTSFAEQLDLAIRRVDKVTVVVMEKISVDLQALVQQHLLQPIGRVVEGITCGFMSTMYQDFVDGMCFRGVWGFTAIAASYLACAVLTVIMVSFVYILWRLSLDNYQAEREYLQRLPVDRE